MVGVYYKPPNQGKPVDEAFLLNLQEASHLYTLILMRVFNNMDVCWENYIAGCKQSRRFLECTEVNFLGQVLDKPARGEALPYPVLTSVDELIKEV